MPPVWPCLHPGHQAQVPYCCATLPQSLKRHQLSHQPRTSVSTTLACPAVSEPIIMLPQAKPSLLESEDQQASFQAQGIIEVTISEDPRKFLMMPKELENPSSLVLIHQGPGLQCLDRDGRGGGGHMTPLPQEIE